MYIQSQSLLLAQRGILGRAPEWLQRLIPSPPPAAGSSGPQPRGFGAAPRATAAAAPARAPAGYRWGAGQRLGDS